MAGFGPRKCLKIDSGCLKGNRFLFGKVPHRSIIVSLHNQILPEFEMGVDALLSHILATGEGGQQLHELMKSEIGQQAVLDIVSQHGRSDFRLLACLALKAALKAGLMPCDYVKSRLLTLIIHEENRQIRNVIVAILSLIFSQMEGQWPEFDCLLEQCIMKGRVGTAVSLALCVSTVGNCEEFKGFCHDVIMKAVEDGNPETMVEALHLAFNLGFCFDASFYIFIIQNVLPKAAPQTAFDICSNIANLVKNGETKDIPKLICAVADVCASDLELEARRACFLVIEATVCRYAEHLFEMFPLISQTALSLCDEAFDDLSATCNGATAISFKFAKYFAKANPEVFWPALQESFKVDTPGKCFGLLSAIQQAEAYYVGPMEQLLGLLSNAIDTEIRSLCELSLQIMYDLMESQEDSLAPSAVLVMTLIRKCVCNHPLLGMLCVQCLARLLFFAVLDKDLYGMASELALRFFQDPFVSNFAAIAVAALAWQFRELSIPCVSAALTIMWDLATGARVGDHLSQPRGIEALSLCVRVLPDTCEKYQEGILGLCCKGVTSTDRQMFVSACWAFKNLLKGRIQGVIPYVTDVSNAVINALSLSPDLKDSIDGSGITMTQVIEAALELTITGLKYVGNFFALDLLNALSAFCDVADTWGCAEKAYLALKTLGYCCPSFLPLVIPRLLARPDVWTYLASVVYGVEGLDMTLAQMISRTCLASFIGGNYAAIKTIVALIRRKGFSYHISAILDVLKHHEKDLTQHGLAEFISLFDALCEAGNFDEKEAWEQAIKAGLESISLCASFELRPTPIRFLGTLVRSGFAFDDQSILNFVGFFADVIGKEGDGEFYSETMIEILNTCMIILFEKPNIRVKWQPFFTRLLPFLPPSQMIDYSVLHRNLLRLRTTIVFTEHEELHQYLYAALVKTIALPDSQLYGLNVDRSVEQGLTEQLLDYCRLSKDFQKQVSVVLEGDNDKIMQLKERCSMFCVSRP